MIIECMPFFNELDLLEIRFEITSQYVDYWVISESTKTFSGKDKPLYLRDNLDGRFSKFKEKIKIINYDCGKDPWLNEHESRNSLGRYVLSNFTDDTIVILTDTDEIPDYRKITFKEELPAILRTKGYYYYLNCRQNIDFGVVSMFKASELKNIQMYRMRACAGNHKTIIDDAGWHWSFLGGATKIKDKIDAYAHQDMNDPQIINHEVIEKNVNDLKDIFGRNNFTYHIVDIDDSYPEYIRENLEKYKHFIK